MSDVVTGGGIDRLLALVIRSRSTVNSAATRRRVLPARSGRRTVARRAFGLRSLIVGTGPSSPHPGSTRAADGGPGTPCGCALTERSAPVDQDPQHRELLVVDDRAKAGHPGTDQRHGVRIGRVGLTALTGHKHPGPRRQLRRDVDDLLTLTQPANRHLVADVRAALDRRVPWYDYNLTKVSSLQTSRGGSVGSRPASGVTGHPPQPPPPGPLRP